MRGILSQMHKIKSPQKNIRRLQKDRNISIFFFVLFLYRVIKDREKINTKICATHTTSYLVYVCHFVYLSKVIFNSIIYNEELVGFHGALLLHCNTNW